MELLAKIVLYIFLIPVIIIAVHWIFKAILGSLAGFFVTVNSLIISSNNKTNFKNRVTILFIGILILCFWIFVGFLGWKLLEIIFNI